MAEPILPPDFVAMVAALERRVRILESTARTPQVSSTTLGGQTAEVVPLENTSSSSYIDLTTPGPAVTVTVPQSGLLTVMYGHEAVSGSGVQGYMAFELSGANVRAAVDSDAVYLEWTGSVTNPVSGYPARTKRLTGLTPGPTAITAKYRLAAGATAAYFGHRWLVAWPL